MHQAPDVGEHQEEPYRRETAGTPCSGTARGETNGTRAVLVRPTKKTRRQGRTTKLPHEAGDWKPFSCPSVTPRSANPAPNASESPPGTSKRRIAPHEPGRASVRLGARPGRARSAPGHQASRQDHRKIEQHVPSHQTRDQAAATGPIAAPAPTLAESSPRAAPRSPGGMRLRHRREAERRYRRGAYRLHDAAGDEQGQGGGQGAEQRAQPRGLPSPTANVGAGCTGRRSARTAGCPRRRPAGSP